MLKLQHKLHAMIFLESCRLLLLYIMQNLLIILVNVISYEKLFELFYEEMASLFRVCEGQAYLKLCLSSDGG